jgi:outer membrane beta-barrel protein
MKSILITVFLSCGLIASTAYAQVMEDFDSLGGNKALLERAKDLNPDSKVEVVQDRIVNRHHRFEISPEFGTVVSGDSFLSTLQTGVTAHYHFNPHWSLGLKYASMSNTLTKDGENLIADTNRTGKAVIPDLDYPIQQYMAVLAWYPLYGKINMFDKGIAHFDVYGQVGTGQIELHSGSTSTWMGGMGIGFWISQHLTSRLELNAQNYKTQRVLGDSNLTLTVASLSMGYML